jgi:hypothetical protein
MCWRAAALGGRPLDVKPGKERKNKLPGTDRWMIDKSLERKSINEQKPQIKYNSAGFLIRIRIRIRINLSCWIRIRIQIADPDPGGQKWPTKIEKSPEFSCF